MKELNRDQLVHIAWGAALFGSGGGGPLSVALRFIDILDNGDPYYIYDATEMEENDLAVVSAIMGSPGQMRMADNIDGVTAAFDEMNRIRQGQINWVMPAEAGAVNMVVPLLLSHFRPVRVMDVDGAGRSIPSMTQCLFSAAGVSCFPTVLAASSQAVVTLGVSEPEQVEDLARYVLTSAQFGHKGGMATWLLSHDQLPENLIYGSLSLCLQAGEYLQSQRQQDHFDITRLLEKIEFLSGRQSGLLFSGRLMSVDTETRNGFDFGSLHFVNDDGDDCIILNQNENLIARNTRSGEILATAPDSICCISVTGQPYSNADFSSADYGRYFHLFRIAACRELADSGSITTAFRKALHQLGYSAPEPEAELSC